MQLTKQQMDTKTAEVGRYSSKLSHDKDYPLIQILTIEDLLNGTERIVVQAQINPFAMVARESACEKQTDML